jgi:hypothetical protein
MTSKAQQHQELIDVLRAGPRRYTIHLTGYGGELVIGSITAEQYEFWHRRREDLDEWSWDSDTDIDVPESMAIFPAGEYYMCDDLAHENGVEFCDACWVTVYDEVNNEVWSSALGDEALEAKGVDTDGIHRGEFYVAWDSKASHAFLAQNTEKGTFWTGEIETMGDFDPRRLSFSVIDIEGWTLVDGVSYESVELDDTGGYSTTGKGSDFRVFQVER